MKRAGRISAVAAFAVLLVIGIFRTDDRGDATPTTVGTLPFGYRALFDLLTELGYPVARSGGEPELPSDATVWWIEPAGVACGAPGAGGEWPFASWVEAGGRAVVFLPGSPRATRCRLGDAVPLPDQLVRASAGASPRERGEHPLVTGDVTPHARSLRSAGLPFADAGDWMVRARLGDHPFVLERALGRGQLVVVADAAFLSNVQLDQADAAPLALDLVEAYGAPRFFEPGAAAGAGRGSVAYLATSPALALFAGMALTGLLFAWQGSLVPPRAAGDAGPGAPSLETFVDSLAALYAATRDHSRVLERYRELTAARLRRHFGLAPDTPLATLIERLRRERRAAPAAIDLLAAGAGARDEAALRAAARALDGLVREATA